MLISIVIATFNAEKTLCSCLDSIVPQLTEDVELIIVDGGSKDATNSIVTSFGNSIAVHISEQDRGIYDAWNKGVKHAKGDWIMFIGADDVLLPGALAYYLEQLKSIPNIQECDYICAHNEFVDMNGKVLKVLGEEPRWKKMRRMMPAAHVASLHNKKRLFESIGLFDFEHFKICADYELLLRKGSKLSFLMLPAHIAKMKVGGMSFSTRAVKETFLIRKLHHSVPALVNYLLFIRDWAAFKFFIFRKTLCGGKLRSVM